MLGTICLVLCAAFAPQGKNPAAGQDVVANRLVDTDYAFELGAPSAEWSVLREQEVTQSHGDGVAGLRGPNGVVGYVLLRKVPKTTLEECQNWLVEQVPVTDRVVTKREVGTFAAQKALLVAGLGSVQGARVRFRVATFLNRGHAFTLFAHGPSDKLAPEAPELQPFFDAFKLGPATPKARAFAPDAQHASGPGWNCDAGTYASPQLGLRIATPSGWRVLTPGNSMLGAAQLGFLSRDPEALVQLAAETLDAALEKAWAEAAAARFSAALDPTVSAALKPATLPFAGLNLEARWYRSRVDPLHHFLIAAGSKDGVSYRASVRALIGDEDRTLKAARALLGEAQPLSPLRRAESALALFARGDESEARIGPDGFMRGGRYKDLGAEFLIDLPSGFWATRVDTTAKLLDTPLRLVFHDDVRALEGSLFVLDHAAQEIRTERSRGLAESKKRSARWWSERVIDALIGPEPDDDEASARRGKNAKEEPIVASSRTLYAMSATYAQDGFPKRVLTAAALRGDDLVVLILRGNAQSVQQAAPSFRRAAATFRWLAHRDGARHAHDGRFEDERLGLSFELGAAWKWGPDAPTGSADGYSCWIQGLSADIVAFDLGSSAALATPQSLARRVEERYGADFGKLEWSQSAAREDVLDGRSARVLDFVGADARVEVDLVRTGGMRYGIAFVRRGAGGAESDEFASLKRGLRFVQPSGDVAELSAEEAQAEADAAKAARAAASPDAEKDAPKDAAKATPKSAPKDAPAGASASGEPANATASTDAASPKVSAHPLELPRAWREISIRDAPASFDLLIAFRAQPSWLERLIAAKTIDTRGADARPQLAAVRMAGDDADGCDTLAVERFALNAQTTTAAAAAAAIVELAQKSQGRAASSRSLEGGRFGAIQVVAWREPVPKPDKDAKPAPKSKSAAAAEGRAAATAAGGANAGESDDGSRFARVYLIATNTRGWSITLRTRRELSSDESAALDKAVTEFEPLP